MHFENQFKMIMNRATLPLLFILLAVSTFAPAQTSEELRKASILPAYIQVPKEASGCYAIWPDLFPPGFDHKGRQEKFEPELMRLRNVALPTITMFKPEKGKENGTAMIVGPGGAFHFLMMRHEGYEVAKWLNQLGITAFVLRYRVQATPADDAAWLRHWEEFRKTLPGVDQYEVYPPSDNPVIEEARLWAEEDGRQAIRFLRQHARELGIDPTKIGIMGFSAGGGVAVNAALRYDKQSRPDFVGAIYAGYRVVSPVPKDLPPLFIATTDDDNLVSPMSSSRLYEDWHKQQTRVELHIFGNGLHGFGMGRDNTLTRTCKLLFENWMRTYGFLPPAN